MDERRKKIIKILLIILISIPILLFGFIYYQISSMYDGSSKNKDEAKEYDSIIVSDDITNILLIGTDERKKNERGRADAIMIATIDEKHKGIKITSIARDTYVYIPAKNRKEKINHAYSYGGADLLKETIETNFNIKISNYVRVNFNSFIEVIDALGGLKLDVKESELKELNKYIPECYKASSKKKPIEYVDNAGVQILNGYQTLSYARIRKNDSAIERDRRQREVIQALMDEFSQINIFEIPKVINAVTKYVTTDMKPTDMIKYAKKVFKMGNFNIKQLEFPMEEYSKGGILSGKGWVLQYNEEKCLPLLHEFIYEEDVEMLYKENNVTPNYNQYQENNNQNYQENNNHNNIENNNHNNTSNVETDVEEDLDIPQIQPPIVDNEESDGDIDDSAPIIPPDDNIITPDDNVNNEGNQDIVNPGNNQGSNNQNGNNQNDDNQGGNNQGGSNQGGSNQGGSNIDGSVSGGNNQGGNNQSGANNQGGNTIIDGNIKR